MVKKNKSAKYVFINKNGFYPKCISNDKTGMKAIGHSATGHLLPCCWCDNGDPGYKSLLTEELKIENNDSIEAIFKSKPWVEFAKKLQNGGKGLPYTCWKYCGKGKHHNTRTKETYT